MTDTQPPAILPITLPDGYTFDMIYVEGGTFLRGDIHGDIQEAARPAHEVELSSFYIAKFPVTQGLWRAVALSAEGKKREINPEPFYHKGNEQLPAENISWNDIYKKFLPTLDGLTGKDFRLPTEAEWEYAARGGKHHRDGYIFAGGDKLKEVAWFDENSGNKTHEVGQKYANQLGLHDMSGNVWEWCADHWEADFYKTCAAEMAKSGKPIKNPVCDRGAGRVLRGGGRWNDSRNCSVAIRYDDGPAGRSDFYGFRLLLQFGASKP